MDIKNMCSLYGDESYGRFKVLNEGYFEFIKYMINKLFLIQNSVSLPTIKRVSAFLFNCYYKHGKVLK